MEMLKEKANRNRKARENWTACEVRRWRLGSKSPSRGPPSHIYVYIIYTHIHTPKQVLVIDEISMLHGTLL